jgi:hypothetical protein
VDLERIVQELEQERDRLNQAIDALKQNGAGARMSKPAGRTAARRTRRRGLTPEGRRRLSEAMKRRWAERRKKGAK